MSLSWTKGEGALILITFTDSLLPVSSSALEHLTVNWQEYDMTPEGTLVSRSEHPSALYFGLDDAHLILEMSASTLFRNAVGTMTIVYDGAGGFGGYGGPVEQFSYTFAPSDLIPYNPNFNDPEHFELTNISATGVLTLITYHEVQEEGEHFELAGITASGTLTYVGDL